VVLVGIRPYTFTYSWSYLEQEVIAIDPDPAMVRYRGRARFAAIRLRDLLAAVDPGSIDLIHCNGVYGWGLDSQDELEESLDRVAEALAPGGLLLLGYNLRHNNPLGWTATTALPQSRLVELHAAEYPACLGNNQVFRLFTNR
jgi:SAM-dependent methyltransferase